MAGVCKPIAPSRTDFGAVLGRCLSEMEFSRGDFSEAIKVQKTQISALINNNPNFSATTAWISDKNILETLEEKNPAIFAKYKNDFEIGLEQLRNKPQKPKTHTKKSTKIKQSSPPKPSLSSEWRKVTSDYFKGLIKFNGDSIEDVIKAMKMDITKDMPPSITRKFLEASYFWNELLHHDKIKTPVVYVREAFNALNTIYCIDENHPFHSRKRKTAIALGLE